MRPALIHVDHWDVSYQLVTRVDHGYALHENMPIMRLGTVEQTVRIIDGLTQRVWEATDADGRRYMAQNKALVIEKMVEGNRLLAVTIDDTIPPLFEEAS